MPHVVINHAVEDVERWLGFKEERASALGDLGSNVTDHVALDGSNKVAVSVDVNDLDRFQAVMASPPPELVAGMERHGVIQPLAVHVEK